MMNDFFQQPLANDLVRIEPLQATDFEALYAVAADPLLWEQHPNPDRWQRPVFEKFFEGALASGGAYLVFDRQTGEVIGSSRYYDFDEKNRSVLIGYTFVSRSCWGKGHNPALKSLMLDHAFQRVDKVLFHIGAQNLRSQISIGRIGAEKIRSILVPYYGEMPKENYEYRITKTRWTAAKTHTPS